MDQYVTGGVIRQLREARGMTQADLAAALTVSDKAVSRWETGRGYPDITLLEPLAAALGISVAELLSGQSVTNRNRSANMLRTKLYVCPVCGNVLTATGEAVIHCCGVPLPPLEAEPADADHTLQVEDVEDEVFVSVPHDMTKAHHLSFLAAVSDDGIQLVKLYPEGAAQARFKRSRVKLLLAYCNHHGLFSLRLGRR